MLIPNDESELREMVRAHRRIIACGGSTKPGLGVDDPDVARITLGRLDRVTDYEPGEFTITAEAGIPLSTLARRLQENGQYLPFDPPLADHGATLGGTIAAGLSGPGRHRYGGIRDFILGIRFIDGRGTPLKGGGKVVKNAAGFDFPKLLTGSLGRLGVIVDATFKVFPGPPARDGERFVFSDQQTALNAMIRLASAPFDLDAVEYEPPAALVVRIAGLPGSLPPRIALLRKFLGCTGEKIGETYWTGTASLDGAASMDSLVKVPLTADRIPALEDALPDKTLRRYSAAGNVAWITGIPDLADFSSRLKSLNLSGLVLKGPPPPLIGIRKGEDFLRRIKQVLDPTGRFPDF